MLVKPEDVGHALELIRSSEKLAVDTETTGVEHHDLPFGMSIATKDKALYLDERVTPNFWNGVAFLGNAQILLQNAKFDMHMLTRKGIHLPVSAVYKDIAIEARIIKNDFNGGRAYSLDEQAKRQGWGKDKAVENYIKEHNVYEERRNFFGEVYKAPRYDRVPLDVMSAYAAHDARLTYDLHERYESQFDSDDRRVLENEYELTQVCKAMEEKGVKLNVEYTLQALHHERGIMESLKRQFNELTGTDFVNSAKSLEKSLDFALPKTKEGNPSLKDEVIEALLNRPNLSAKSAKVLELVRGIRMYDKRISTYYEAFLNAQDSSSFIHPSMWQAGTRTGRFSCSNPNLQNVPKEEDSTDPYVIRGCFKPRNSGRCFVSIDYKQMEYRMAAAYANESGVIRDVMSGADFHQATASMVGISRSQAKTLNFAILYGAGDKKIAQMLGTTLEQAQLIITKYYLNLPKIDTLIGKIKETAHVRGFIRTWLGRKLRFGYHRDPETEQRWHDSYSAPNHLIQGGCADVVKKAMVEVAREFPFLDMILQIHDQLVFDMEPSQFHLIPRIKEIMESVWEKNGMRLEVDIKHSYVSLAERDLLEGMPHAAA